jgi:transposase
MKPTSQKKKESIISFLQKGLSTRQVAAKLSVSKSTVASISKESDLGVPKSKGGRPGILSDRGKTFCVQKVTRDRLPNAVKVKKTLENDLGIVCNAETVPRALREKGLGAIEKQPKPLLRKKNIKN